MGWQAGPNTFSEDSETSWGMGNNYRFRIHIIRLLGGVGEGVSEQVWKMGWISIGRRGGREQPVCWGKEWQEQRQNQKSGNLLGTSSRR